jgi:hypothetical protein
MINWLSSRNVDPLLHDAQFVPVSSALSGSPAGRSGGALLIQDSES